MNFITKLLKRIFNRTTVCVIGILIQVGYLVSLFWSLGTMYTYSYLVFEIAGILISLIIVNSDMNPSYKIAWIVPMLIVPVFGVMFYIF